jgi:heat shock protein HslJ/uncharacterized membrane protein
VTAVQYQLGGIIGVVLAGCLGGCAHRSGAGLANTAWRLESLGATAVLDRVEATLEFPDTGKVAGKGSCNSFFGSVKISGSSISFASLGSTRMACAEPVMDQESKYLQALEGAERFRIDGTTLLIYVKGLDQPLRFTSTRPAKASGAEPFRAVGTEPFWALEIDSTGFLFKTPDNISGVHWPPSAPLVTRDTLRWVRKTRHGEIEARIWPGQCSDGMSDRTWEYSAEVRIDTTRYSGCAESSPRLQP